MTKWGIFAACAAVSAFAPWAVLAQDASPATHSAIKAPAPGDPVQTLLEPMAGPQPFSFAVRSVLPRPARLPVPDEPVASTVRLGDVEVVQAPPPSTYQPEGTTMDLMDNGKRFDIACRIDNTGGMDECEVAPNDMVDKNFVEIALNDVSQTVVGPVAEDGAPTAGRTLVVTCHFKRADGDSLGAMALADGNRIALK